MSKRQNPVVKHILDMALAVTLLVALCFPVTSGGVHEWTGVLWCLLGLLHCWWNRRWFKGLGRGRYPLPRVVDTLVIILLALGLLLICVTGLLNSSHIFSALNLDGSVTARRVHAIASYWSLVLAGIHTGMQWRNSTGLLRYHPAGGTLRTVRFFAALVVLGGVWASCDRSMGDKLFFGPAFDFWNPDRPGIFLFAAYLAIWGASAVVAHGILAVAKKKPEQKTGSS